MDRTPTNTFLDRLLLGRLPRRPRPPAATTVGDHRSSGLRFLASSLYEGPRPEEAWTESTLGSVVEPHGIEIHLRGPAETAHPGIPVAIQYATTPAATPQLGTTSTRYEAIGPAAPTSGLWAHPLIDPRNHNPVGTRTDLDRPIAILAHARSDIDEIQDLVPESLRGRVEAQLLSYTEPRELDGGAVRDFRAIIDHPDLHPSTAMHAESIAVVTSLGCPILGRIGSELRERIGEALADAIDATDPADIQDPTRLEAASVRQRRAALATFGQTRAWRTIARRLGFKLLSPPAMSVLLATNRPHRVLEAVDRFEAFTYPERELILALHGSEPDRQLRQRAAANDRVHLLEVPSDRVLGDVLNHATDRAGGEVIVKMDDDDLYGTDHLDDLDLALEYSGASVVGKAAAFVYLEEIDMTIRRMQHGAETSSRTIAGGAFAVTRAALRDVGGWRRIPRSVDQGLFEDVERAGGRLHRTHPFGFLLWRTTSGHTWETPIDYFLRQAVEQWRGLALHEAGIQ